MPRHHKNRCCRRRRNSFAGPFTPGKTRGCPKSNPNCNLGGMTWVTLTTAWNLQAQNNYLSTWGSGVY